MLPKFEYNAYLIGCNKTLKYTVEDLWQGSEEWEGEFLEFAGMTS
jgi:hypothetical protein